MTLRIKAFDTIDHDILLSKLHLCGISGVTHKINVFPSSFSYIIILRHVLSIYGSHSEIMLHPGSND